MPTEPTNPSTPTTPTPPAPSGTARRSPSPINRKYLTEIELIRELVTAARVPDRVTPLADAGWPATRVSALDASAGNLEGAALNAVGRTHSRGMNTEDEADARRQLLAALHPIRAGAKRKYRNVPNAPAGRATYFVNQESNVSLDRLLFIAGYVLLKLTPQAPATTPEDTLPGVTPAVLTTLQTTRAAYAAADATQGATESEKNQAHVGVTAAYTGAHAERVDLQLAADQVWTFHDPAHAAIRRDFKIPPDRAAIE